MSCNIQNNWTSEKKEWRSVEEYVLYLKQRKAYEFTSRYCAGKKILDYGCGSGYGTYLLASCSESVLGMDISKEVIEYCSKTYANNNLSYRIIEDIDRLSFRDGEFDIITSFQVIEHIPNVKKYLRELSRILSPSGVLLISTPNKKYRLLPFQKPWNEEHLREYYMKEFKKELKTVFPIVDILAVYGKPEINYIEYRRVRQDPYKVYFGKPVKKYVQTPAEELLKKILPPSIVLYCKKMRQENKTEQNIASINADFTKKYNLNDFMVGEDFRKALDFVAICRKNKDINLL